MRHLAAERDPGGTATSAAIIAKLSANESTNAPNTDERERDVVRLEVGHAREPLDAEPDDERDHRVGVDVREQLVRREPVAQRVDQHGDDADQHRRRGPAQRHREHEREERAADPLRPVLEREQVADHREREQHGDEPERLPVVGLGRRRGGDQRAEQDHGLGCEQPFPAVRHLDDRYSGPRRGANGATASASEIAAARARCARRARGSRAGTTRWARGCRRRGARSR